MTHELESQFDLSLFGEKPLPPRSPEEAAEILVELSRVHLFVFYKYQMADLVSHTGQIEIARSVFAIVERFVKEVLSGIDPEGTLVIVTSDHGHLEQMEYHRGHPKSKVPTWCFGSDSWGIARTLIAPEAIYHAFERLCA